MTTTDMETADRRGHNKPPMKNTPEDKAVSDRAGAIGAAKGKVIALETRLASCQN